MGSALRHRVLQATSAPALPEVRSCGTLAPCHPEPGRPGPDAPSSPVLSSQTAAWGSTEVFRGFPPFGARGGGEFPSHIPAGRLRALGSSRAGPGPLFSLTPSVILLCGPVIIGTMCLVKLLRRWEVPRFPGHCVWEAGLGPADTPSLPPTPLLCPLSHRAAERGGQPTPALRPNDPPLPRRHLCTCLAEVRCPARVVRAVRTSCWGDDLE